MEDQIDLMDEQSPAVDVKSAIGELQSRNAVFEERFANLGEALAQINSGLQGLRADSCPRFSVQSSKTCCRRK